MAMAIPVMGGLLVVLEVRIWYGSTWGTKQRRGEDRKFERLSKFGEGWLGMEDAAPLSSPAVWAFFGIIGPKSNSL